MLITESWLRPDLPDSFVHLPDYTLFRLDRHNQTGGGICIFVKNTVAGHQTQAKLCTQYKTEHPIEAIWLEITINTFTFVTACIYRPKSSTTPDQNKELTATVAKALESKTPTFLFGDFNYTEINWENLTVYPHNQCSEDFFNSYQITNAHQLITFPTRYRNDEISLLDLLLVNDKSSIFNIQQHPPIGRSDHVVITAKTQIQLASKPTKKIYKRNFWQANYDEINKYMTEQLEASTCQIDATQLTRLVTETIELFVPLKPKQVNTKKPWLNREAFKQINAKRKLWDKYKRTKANTDYEHYKQQNNTTKQMLNQARREYEQNLLQAPVKKFYSYIKHSLNSRLQNFVLRNTITNQITCDEDEIANCFADQFQRVFTQEDNILPTLPPNLRIVAEINNIQFTPEKVQMAISSLKAESSPGPDEIPSFFLKNCSKALCSPIATILNSIMSGATLPDIWKSSIVVPIFKKGDKLEASNYRPISLTCVLCKCMEKIIVKELTSFLLEQQVIPDCQHGFLPGRSTFTNLLERFNRWTQMDDNKIPFDIVYLDFEKAFDKVPFRRLLLKSEHNGIRGNVHRVISELIQGRTFRVKIGSAFSSSREVHSGVPQGSVIAALLFILYISDLPADLVCETSSFADDTNSTCRASDQHLQMQRDLDNIKQWTITWQMPLNESKCAILHVGRNNPNHVYTIGNTEVTPVEKQKDLGILVTRDLKWECHVATSIKKVNTLIYLVRNSFKNLSSDMILRLYKTYIRPKLEYMQSIWSPYYVKDIDLLEKFQRRVTKIPSELKDLSYEERLQRLNLTTLYQRRQRGDLIETYKITSGHYKCNTINIFIPADNTHLRGHNKKLKKEKSSKLLRRNFLTNRVVYLWNNLSQDTVNATSVNSFKNRLDKDLSEFNNQFVHYPQ